MEMIDNFLVEPTELDEAAVILDCRPTTAFQTAHIPTAIGLPIDYWLKEDDENGIARGERLISADQFAHMMGGLGITADTPVVVYDENQGRGSARVWWVMKHFGHRDVRILNGGWPRWVAEGHPTTNAPIQPPRPATYITNVRDDMTNIEELLCRRADIQVVDARSREEWVGTDPHGNPRAGRIPDAIHLEWKSFVTDDTASAFRPLSELREIVAASRLRADRPIVTYCQAGVRASHVAFVLTMLGFQNVRVFDGSMRTWSRREDAPLAVGD
jgi:thiosulfate/3-mercaptopyruvate sulfurtransferase